MATVIDKPANEMQNDGAPEPTGVRCPSCHCRHCPVIGGTHRHFRTITRKKRRCRHCGKMFWTREEVIPE